MARVGWEDCGDGIWFASYKSRKTSFSLLIEQQGSSFVELACPATSDEYIEVGCSPSLTEAKADIIAVLRENFPID